MVDTDRPDLIRRATSPYRCTDAIVPTVLKVRKNMGHRSYRILHIITSGSDLRVDGHGGSDATRRIGTGTPDTTPVPWSRGRVFGRAIFPAICVFNAIRRRSTISSRNGERESIRSRRRRPTCHEPGSIRRPRGRWRFVRSLPSVLYNIYDYSDSQIPYERSARCFRTPAHGVAGHGGAGERTIVGARKRRSTHCGTSLSTVQSIVKPPSAPGSVTSIVL